MSRKTPQVKDSSRQVTSIRAFVVQIRAGFGEKNGNDCLGYTSDSPSAGLFGKCCTQAAQGTKIAGPHPTKLCQKHDQSLNRRCPPNEYV